MSGATGAAAQAAKRNHVYLCAGLTEKDGDRVYNSAIFSAPDGTLLLKYRKINELGVGHVYYALGKSLSVVETPLDAYRSSR